jgi:hypothetical protein
LTLPVVKLSLSAILFLILRVTVHAGLRLRGKSGTAYLGM